MARAQREYVGSLAMFGAGGAVACAAYFSASVFSARSDPDVPAVAVWAADRDADRVFGLDRDLIRKTSLEIACPLRVVTCQDGGAWVLHARDRSPDGRAGLTRISSAGEVRLVVGLGTGLDLALHGDDRALVLERVSTECVRAISVDQDGRLTELARDRAFSVVLGDASSVWIGSADGRLARIEPECGAWLAPPLELEGEVRDLAPAREPGWVWVLAGGARRRLVLVDADMHVTRELDLPPGVERFASDPTAPRVWLVDAAGGRAGRLDSSGPVEWRAMQVAGLETAASWRDGGVLLAVPGAILRLDRNGRARPGQGGFGYLTDLAVVTAPDP